MNRPISVKLFVSCHQPDQIVPPHPLLVPIQVGAALSEYHFPGFVQDDIGENISYKNKVYCELTAQYWAWKNAFADYYGFFHYRRYLFPCLDIAPSCVYIIKPESTLEQLDSLGYDTFQDLIADYDLIVPRKENMQISVRQHYASAPNHHKEDLDIIERVIEEKYPDYIHAKDTYFSNSMCYFGNIFIMRKELFYTYCKWLFSILTDFEAVKDISSYSAAEKRVAGYLGERLLGVFVTYQQQKNNALHILELPRVHFEPNQIRRMKQIFVNMLFPPGSKKRACVKSIVFHQK